MKIRKWDWILYFSLAILCLDIPNLQTTQITSTQPSSRDISNLQTTQITSTQPSSRATSIRPQPNLCAGVLCHQNADCVRYTDNLSQCECRDNFVGNGAICTDLCTRFRYNCPYASCESGDGGFCICSGNNNENGNACKVYACEDEGDRSINCVDGFILNILYANYGRTSANICKNDNRTNCRSDSLSIVKRLCQDKQECTLSPNSNVFGNPCSGIHKYLEVHYQCNKAPSTYLDATVIGIRKRVQKLEDIKIPAADCSTSFGLVRSHPPIFQVFNVSKEVSIRKVTLVVKAIPNYIPKYQIQVSNLYDVGYCGDSSTLHKSYPPNTRVSVGCNFFSASFITVIGLTSKDTIDICHIEVQQRDGSILDIDYSPRGVFNLVVGDSATNAYLISINKNIFDLSNIPHKRRKRSVSRVDMQFQESTCVNLGSFPSGGDIVLAVPLRTMEVTKVTISLEVGSFVPEYMNVFISVRGNTRGCLRNTGLLKQVFYCENFELYNFVGPYVYVTFSPTDSLSICDIEIQGLHPSSEVYKAEIRKGLSMCFKESFGDDSYKGMYTANTTQGLMYFRAPCKYNKDKMVTRYCRKNGYDNATWDAPNLEACVPKLTSTTIPPPSSSYITTYATTTPPLLLDTTTELLNELNNKNVCDEEQTANCLSANETATKLNQIVNDSVVITPKDIKLSSTVISNIVKNAKKEELPEVAENVVSTVSKIMETEKPIITTAEAGDKSATSILKDLDKLALKIGESIPKGINIITTKINTKNIGLQVAKVPKMDIAVEAELLNVLNVDLPDDFTPFSMNIFASAVIPNATFNSSDEVIYSYAYRDGSLFVDTDAKTELRKNNLVQSVVLSISLGEKNISSLTNPILLRFKKQRLMKRASTCVFWEFGKGDGSGKWSSSGCRLVKETIDGNVTCACDHLTSFAILFDVYQTGNNPKALQYITYIGSGISLVGLVLTFLVHTSCRELRKKLPSKILTCLSISFVLLLVIFLAGVAEADSRLLCQVIAGLLHYFLLALWAWMGVTAINLFRFIVLVFRSHDKRFFMISSIFAWGAPLIIVVVTGVVEPSSLGNDEICFVRGNPFYFAVLLPILLVLLSNFIFFIIIVVKLCRRARPSDRLTPFVEKEIVDQCRIAFSVSVLLGLTWLFAIFAVDNAEFTFQLLFCIFNALQGFLIFVLYTLRNPTVLEKMNYYCCCKSDRGKSITSSSAVSDSKGTKTTNAYPMRGYPNEGMNSVG